jgi:dihydrofolate reductase
MNLSIIAAIGKNHELGYQNKLLWHIPADLKRFKTITSGHTVIMGMKTFESIGSKPLPNRRNIVLTHRDLKSDTVIIANSIRQIFELIDNNEETFILGGALLYRQLLPMTRKMYLTHIEKEYSADTFFPAFDRNDWNVIENIRVSGDKKAGVDYSFITYLRIESDNNSFDNPS